MLMVLLLMVACTTNGNAHVGMSREKKDKELKKTDKGIWKEDKRGRGVLYN